MPKVRYTEAKGLVQQAGSGFQLDDMPYTSVQAKTAAFTIAQPGVFTVTAGAAVGVTMPVASAFPGAIFTVRNGDAYANFLTSSLSEAQGTLIFKAIQSGSLVPQTQGSKLTLAASTGGSATVYCDGLSYLVLASSGSVSISGT